MFGFSPFSGSAFADLLETNDVSVTLTGVVGSVFLGTAEASANAVVIETGEEATAFLGTVTTQADANVAIIGVSATGALGVPDVTGIANVVVTGVSATTALGVPTVAGSSIVQLVGVQAVGTVTRPLVWSAINDNQIPDWTEIRDGNRYEGSLGALFGFGSFSEVSFASLGFDGIPEEQWRTVNDGNTVVWVEIPT